MENKEYVFKGTVINGFAMLFVTLALAIASARRQRRRLWRMAAWWQHPVAHCRHRMHVQFHAA